MTLQHTFVCHTHGAFHQDVTFDDACGQALGECNACIDEGACAPDEGCLVGCTCCSDAGGFRPRVHVSGAVSEADLANDAFLEKDYAYLELELLVPELVWRMRQ